LGQKRQDVEGWKEGGLRYRGVEYWTGPGEDKIELRNGMEEKLTKIWLVLLLDFADSRRKRELMRKREGIGIRWLSFRDKSRMRS